MTSDRIEGPVKFAVVGGAIVTVPYEACKDGRRLSSRLAVDTIATHNGEGVAIVWSDGDVGALIT